jgi:hypothetical protein
MGVNNRLLFMIFVCSVGILTACSDNHSEKINEPIKESKQTQLLGAQLQTLEKAKAVEALNLQRQKKLDDALEY